MLRMQGGYELASMPLKKKQRSTMTASISPLPISSDKIDNNDILDSVVDVEEMSQTPSQATKSTVIKDQIIGKLQEQNLLLKERLVKEESHSHALGEDLQREKRRVTKKKKANRHLKEDLRTLQIHHDTLKYS